MLKILPKIFCGSWQTGMAGPFLWGCWFLGDRPNFHSPGCNDGVLGPEAMQRSVLQVHGYHAPTGTSLHQQVQGKVLNEVLGVVPKGLDTRRKQQLHPPPIDIHVANTIQLKKVSRWTLMRSQKGSVEKTNYYPECRPSELLMSCVNAFLVKRFNINTFFLWWLLKPGTERTIPSCFLPDSSPWSHTVTVPKPQKLWVRYP